MQDVSQKIAPRVDRLLYFYNFSLMLLLVAVAAAAISSLSHNTSPVSAFASIFIVITIILLQYVRNQFVRKIKAKSTSHPVNASEPVVSYLALLLSLALALFSVTASPISAVTSLFLVITAVRLQILRRVKAEITISTVIADEPILSYLTLASSSAMAFFSVTASLNMQLLW